MDDVNTEVGGMAGEGEGGDSGAFSESGSCKPATLLAMAKFIHACLLQSGWNAERIE